MLAGVVDVQPLVLGRREQVTISRDEGQRKELLGDKDAVKG